MTSSNKIRIQINEGPVHLVDANLSILEALQRLNPDLLDSAVAAEIEGQRVDLTSPLTHDASIRLLSMQEKEGREIFWHSTAHLLAHAVKSLFPNAKLGIGPAIDQGFYYDFAFETPITTDDLPRIEEKMRELSHQCIPFIRERLSRKDALHLFQERQEDFKVELLQEIPEEEVTVYKNDHFVDLCRGPHVPDTGYLKFVKLLSLAGAYWRGDERNPVLQRIYGISFPSESQLNAYLTWLEEAKKRDHRKLGRELDLFSFQSEGPGFVFWHPNGMVLYNIVQDYMRQMYRKHGYQEIRTPIILNESLWHRSGHWDHYKDNMYFTEIDGETYAIKPMNCPGGLLVYRNTLRSYRDLPIKMAEMGLVHRHEKSGVLHGLFRVRQFTQDDAHIFCTPDQLATEVVGIMDMVDEVYGTFGFDTYHLELSTRPAKSIGSDAMWELAERVLEEALKKKGRPYTINKGEGAFYGPKIDYHIRDSLGRTWQCGTIQVDFSMPERFELEYIGPDGGRHRPVMIHRAIFGSIERFIGILLEHYGGAFPVWLAPTQCVIIPITERHREGAKEIVKRCEGEGLRVRFDDRNEKVGFKIREAEIQKVPYMGLIGDRELQNGTISVRRHKEGDLGSWSVEQFIATLTQEEKRRTRH